MRSVFISSVWFAFSIPSICSLCGEIRVVDDTPYSGTFGAIQATVDGAEEDRVNYWLSTDGEAGDKAYFVLDLGCEKLFKGIRIRNTHNKNHNDRGTKKFIFYSGDTEDGPWTELITGEIQDARNVKNVPLEEFFLPEARTDITSFIKFETESFYIILLGQ